MGGLISTLIEAYATIRAAKIEADKDKTDEKAGALLRRMDKFCKAHKAAVVTVTLITLSLTALVCWRVLRKEPEPLPPDENPILRRDIGTAILS